MSSKIQWTSLTRNPLKVKSGGNYCEKISPGCAHCYASELNSRGNRFGGNGKRFSGFCPSSRPEMALDVNMLQSWARMTKPKKIFVGSMTDVFGEWVPDWQIFALFDAMAQAPRQTFQLLTKRPERMAEVTRSWLNTDPAMGGRLPGNIWLGVSAEDQQRLSERLPWLIRAPANVRFLSLEPLLGPIVFPDPDGAEPIDYIDWIIIGGESGPNARPMKLAWLEDILRQCKNAGIPAFVKQLGSHWAKSTLARDSKGGNPDEWPKEFRVRIFPGEVWR